MFERVHESQNQFFLSLETPRLLKTIQEKSIIIFETYRGWKSKNLENPKLRKFWKRRVPNNVEDPSIRFLTILKMGSISSKVTKLIFGNFS